MSLKDPNWSSLWRLSALWMRPTHLFALIVILEAKWNKTEIKLKAIMFTTVNIQDYNYGGGGAGWGGGRLPVEVWSFPEVSEEEAGGNVGDDKQTCFSSSFFSACKDRHGWERRAQMRRQRVHVPSQLYQVQPRLSVSLLRAHTRMLMRRSQMRRHQSDEHIVNIIGLVFC